MSRKAKPAPGPKTAWADRPVWGLLALAFGAILCVIPGWLMWDKLGNFRLLGDDFAFLAESRSGHDPWSALWKPHNAHVVPLFRLGVAVLARLGGSLGSLPAVLGYASYAALVLVMLAGGHVVAWETRRLALGLAAMLGLGATTVMMPATTWFSAGQTLWAGFATLVMLLALQAWRGGGRTWQLALAGLAALAAPAIWSGGFAAGVVGMAYLWADGRSRCRKAALVPPLMSLVYAGVVVLVAGNAVLGSIRDQQARDPRPTRPWRGLTHTAQAIPESLVFKNLGLDAATTPAQGVVFCLALAIAWAWSRRSVRPNTLEASGMSLVVTAYLLALTFRGGFEFASLRSLGWYNTMPQIGWVLFLSGWWAGPALREPGRPQPLTRREVLAVAGLALVLLALQVPRAETIVIAEAPPMTESEELRFPIPELQRLRSLYFASELSDRQWRALIRLDRAGEVARQEGIGREAIRQTFGRIVLPGWPDALTEYDALDLLVLPERGPVVDRRRIIAALGELLANEPRPRPTWLPPDEAWPPPDPPRGQSGPPG